MNIVEIFNVGLDLFAFISEHMSTKLLGRSMKNETANVA